MLGDCLPFLQIVYISSWSSFIKHLCTHIHTLTYTCMYILTHGSYLTVIGVHEMHGRIYPNYCQITVGSWPPFIVGLHYDDPLSSLATNKRTYVHTHYTNTHLQRIVDTCDVNGCVPCLVVPPKKSSPIVSIRCKCHVKVEDKTAKRAKTKLILASIVALGFMAGEVVGELFIRYIMQKCVV